MNEPSPTRWTKNGGQDTGYSVDRSGPTSSPAGSKKCLVALGFRLTCWQRPPVASVTVGHGVCAGDLGPTFTRLRRRL
jgi:hypothetical protein